MIYPSSFEVKTGFDQVRELVKEHCLIHSAAVRKWMKSVLLLIFIFLKKSLNKPLSLRRFAFLRKISRPTIIRDLTPGLKKARVEGTYLETEEVFDLKRSLETIKAILRFFKNTPAEKYPKLKKLAGEVKYFSYIDDRIDAILSKHGKIKDNASPDLRHMRDAIAQKQASAGKRSAKSFKKSH